MCAGQVERPSCVGHCTHHCDSHVDWHQRLSVFCCQHVAYFPAFAGPTLPTHKSTAGGGIGTVTAHNSLRNLRKGTAAYPKDLHNYEQRADSDDYENCLTNRSLC